MKVYIVPNEVSEAINKKLNDAFREIEISSDERQVHFDTLLEYFNDHGIIPDFKVTKTMEQTNE